MPIYDFGYRGYDGPIGSLWLRWLVITRQGVRLAMRHRLLRRVLFFSWTPMLYFSVIFFMIGSITEIKPEPVDVPGLHEPGFWEDLWKAKAPPTNLAPPSQHPPEVFVESEVQLGDEPAIDSETEQPLSERDRQWNEYIQRRDAALETTERLIMGIRGNDRWAYNRAAGFLGQSVALRLAYDAPTVRSAAWTTCFYYYVSRVQITVMVFVVMMVAPPLISNDLRGRSFLIYFSSAITKRDYIVGKVAVVLSLIASVTLLPGIALYVMSIAFAPSIGALADTFQVMLRMALLIVMIGVPSSLGALYLSARTTHPRFAGFSWIAIWIMGAIFYKAITETVSKDSVLNDWAFLLSPYHLMTMLAEWIFDVRGHLDAIGANHLLADRLPEHGFAIRGMMFLALLSVLAVWGIHRRINAPMSV